MKMMRNDIDFTYLNQPPKKYTFEQPQLKLWIEKWCVGKVLNLFAGRILLNVDEFRVDSNKEMVADYYGDALEFLMSTTMKFDTVVMDPPYNLRKSREKYFGEYIGSLTNIKNNILRVLNDRSRVISLRYSSVGMSSNRGFKKIAICLVCHNGDHNDTICTVEEM